MKQYIRKNVPKQLAIVDQSACTGCLACVEVCPVDCIHEIKSDIAPQQFVSIDLSTCIGCELCVHTTKNPGYYDIKVCPWNALEMVESSKAEMLQNQLLV